MIHKSLRNIVGKTKFKISDMEIKVFHFNPIVVNTYIISDETNEAIIVDPGNCRSYEDEQIKAYVLSKNLKIKYIINTHPHVDHVAGNGWCVAEYKAPVCMHKAGLPIYEKSYAYAVAFGMSIDSLPNPDKYLNDGDELSFGNTSFSILYTPGHCDGSICLVFADSKIVLTGDLIFENSVGRSDLPTGNETVLMQSIKEKIFALDDDFVILSGHGDKTTVGQEKKMNPYIR